MAKRTETTPGAAKAEPQVKAKPKGEAQAAKPAAKGRKAVASTTPLVPDRIAARLVGDQLRGIAYLAKKLALAIEEKNLRVPVNPADVKELSDRAYALAADLQPAGDDGSNGG